MQDQLVAPDNLYESVLASELIMQSVKTPTDDLRWTQTLPHPSEEGSFVVVQRLIKATESRKGDKYDSPFDYRAAEMELAKDERTLRSLLEKSCDYKLCQKAPAFEEIQQKQSKPAQKDKKKDQKEIDKHKCDECSL